MNFGFWEKIKKPIFVMAPMADVTDAAFRRIIAKYGKPDVLYTEFVSADGLCSPGREKLLIDFMYGEGEHPIVAQIFSSKPEKIKEAAKLAQDLGFDGVDINMGCPVRAVEKQGCGAALIKNPKRAREIIRAAKEGAPTLPISVKTRIGYNKNELPAWLPELLAEEPAAVIIHARTRKEMSNVPARWEHVKEAVEIRNNLKSKTLILGNGDVQNMEDAKGKAESTGADGVMLGRAIFGNPWLFTDISRVKYGEGSSYVPTNKEKLLAAVEHTKLFEKLLGGKKNFAIMKKHYKAYVNGWDGAKEFRMKLMEAKDAEEVEKMVKEYLKNTDLKS